jgi:lambda repressor-like predicted transcriptional regulator
MHHEDIKAAMRKKGVRSSDLARHLGVSAMAVSDTLRGRTKSRRIADAVSKIVGRPIHEIWPGLYNSPSAQERVAGLLRTKQRRAA